METSKSTHRERRFSLSLFTATVGLSFLGFLFVLSVVAPSIWKVQITASWWKILLVFVAVHFVNGFLEYIFHGQVLHGLLFPFLKYFYHQHDEIHHDLTRIVRRRENVSLVGEEPRLLIENRYHIVSQDQFAASFFPWYSFLVFGCILSVPFVFAQWLLPTWPIFLGGFLGLALSLFLYETIHAMEHNPRFQNTSLSLHHARHHADPHSNRWVSGFFGLPVWDWILGTYVKPLGNYKDGSVADPRDFESPIPRFRFVRWLDAKAEERVAKREMN